jgi:signal transduction histidine kinase
MKGRLITKLIIWSASAIAGAFLIDVGLNYLGWANTPGALMEMVFSAGLVLFLFVFAKRLVIDPLRSIEDTAHRIQEGDLTARVHINSSKEFEVLSDSLNVMVESLYSAYEQMKASSMTLEKAVEARTQAVTVERDKLSSIFMNIPDGLVFIGTSGEILEVNPKMDEIWGIKPEEMVGHTVDGLPGGPLKDCLGLDCGVREVTVAGRDYKVTDTLVLDADKSPAGAIKTFSDITEAKLLEKKKADFISLVTHDLKSPLTSIIGYTDLILTEEKFRPSGEAEEFIRAIRSSGERLLEMVEQYLDLSRIEAGMLEMKKGPVRLKDILDEALTTLTPQMREKGITLTEDLHPGLPAISADREKMVRVVSNLISNAVKYTPSGGAVTVSGREVAGNGGGPRLEICVSDNGYGMDESELPHIFDRYYRSGRGSTGVKGSGLGLAVVKSLVEAHGGEVTVESAPGKGSSFRVLIPVSE